MDQLELCVLTTVQFVCFMETVVNSIAALFCRVTLTAVVSARKLGMTLSCQSQQWQCTERWC